MKSALPFAATLFLTAVACAQTDAPPQSTFRAPPTDFSVSLSPAPDNAPPDMHRIQVQLQTTQEDQKAAEKNLHLYEQILKDQQGALSTSANPFFSDSPFADGGSEPALLLTSPLDDQTRAEWSEDLSIMARLVRDAIAHATPSNPTNAMGITVASSSPQVSASYIEGFGVLLSASVPFPLSGETAQPATAPAAADPSSAWDRAKSEVDGTSRPIANTLKNAAPFEPFDPARVDSLRKNLIAAIAEAKHFRHLTPDQSILITITSQSFMAKGVILTVPATPFPANAGRSTLPKTTIVTPDDSSPSIRVDLHAPARLTLKAKKSDTDAAPSPDALTPKIQSLLQ